ncbi:probable menaquinol-cytochrome c reductase cytochrome c subunit [Arthrobacter sp. Hiyo8]|uniref:Cytochrome bc1 complex cytochrome c subunit n=1 Tax=Arthrobacter bambusae TaxID=1338426 RepID=A0AAW8DGK1_9MICC|nr:MULTISPECIES: cytochrome c [Arthrobacter]BAS12174.1 probable menaquinol-cytochrome c reductase cytochrome c subunit [Arthrobacter sp. Hiyo8]MDP9904244.1 ubiquinol-cytochrome c reductase cytochrome c subunit [Arthrobacter bambusae]MDQ0127760.1 ubiquinol-cytochrome c reductase cytochrome c subunit [Arthrobacter bambusae]MDQ0179102.1 ubiquinol-cytochrome c reductase cytochrome c subunit [Arthrobacter bambusae]MDQ0239750.1 ubiquinol-cytochrome c reductase cytochrome c subunit [Arthrobacter bamb
MKALSQKRRHPLAAIALLLMGLLVTGGLYAVATTVNQAKADTTTFSASDAQEGGKLFAANCATCHGMGASGTKDGPSLVGVGAAAVDFQVGTGRMPMQMNGPQAQEKPRQFNDQQTQQLAAYVASLGAGPSIPDASLLDEKGDAAKGGELFRVNCAMCHNAAAAGGALTRGKFAPALAGVSGQHIYEAMATGPQNMPVFNDANISPEGKRDIITFLKKIETNGSPGGNDLGGLGPVSEGLFVWVAGLGVIIAFTIWLTSRTS